MNKTKTIFTDILEELTEPIPYQLCPSCNVEFPAKPKYFHGKAGDCLFCQQSRQMPLEAYDTDFTIPPNPGEKKCAVCGRNFKDNNHNFDASYHHPSGNSPCCLYCQSNRTRAVHYLRMANRHANQAELDALEAARGAGNLEEMNRIITLRQTREQTRRNATAEAQIEAEDSRHRKDFAKVGLDEDRHGNHIDQEGNILLMEGQTAPYNMFNPRPNWKFRFTFEKPQRESPK